MNLTATQMDALQEMVNIGVGQAAGVLNAMLRSHVTLRLPVIEILSQAELESRITRFRKQIFSAVRVGFKGPFTGSASLIFPTDSAAKLVIMLTEDDLQSLDMDEIRAGTLTEVGNIVLNSVMGAIGNELHQRLFYTVPAYLEDPFTVILAENEQDNRATVIWIQTQFSLQEQQIDGDIVILFGFGSIELLIAAIERAE